MDNTKEKILSTKLTILERKVVREMKSFISENVLVTRDEFEEILMRNNRSSRASKRFINVKTLKCKYCDEELPDDQPYGFEEVGDASVKVITCPYCGLRQATQYIVDRAWGEYEMAL